jgi:ABC-type nitrate/sulfonate/bicarbonate transport system substrate-binding protein
VTHLRISCTDGAGYVLNWAALCGVARGFYRDEGLDVELVFQPEAEQTADLMRGAIDVARRGPDPHLDLVEARAPVRTIAGVLRRAPLYAYARAGISTLHDVRGRIVAGNASRAASFMLRMVLADVGIGDDDWTSLETGAARARLRALIEGRADLALLSPPLTFAAEAAGLQLVLSMPARYPALLYASIQVRAGTAIFAGDALVRMLRADIRAQHWLDDPANRSDAAAILAQAYGISLDDATGCYDTLVVRDRVYCTHAELDRGAFDAIADALVRFAGLRRTLAFEDYVDRRFLAAASRST